MVQNTAANSTSFIQSKTTWVMILHQEAIFWKVDRYSAKPKFKKEMCTSVKTIGMPHRAYMFNLPIQPPRKEIYIATNGLHNS